MQIEKNIANAFFEVADRFPEKTAYSGDGLELPFSKLAMAVSAFAIRMREIGIDSTSSIMLDTKSPLVSVSTLYASALLGAKMTPFSKAALETSDEPVTHILRSSEMPERELPNVHDIDQSWSPAHVDVTTRPSFPPVDTSRPWLLMSSAGTTGTPKKFVLSQQIAFDRIMAIRDYVLAGCETNVLLFPPNSRPFYIRGSAALMNGATIVDEYDPACLQERGVDLVCGSPSQAVHWLANKVISPKLKRLLVTGARLPDRAAEHLLKSFEIIEDVYGASETSQSYITEIRSMDGKCVKRGRRLDSDVEIVNQEFEPCALGEIGMVRVKNDYMIDGYIGHPDATAAVFMEGWFYPGDFARWVDDGVLNVTGRIDETVNLGGVKVNLKAIDETMTSVEGVAYAVSFRNPHPDKINELMAVLQLEDIKRRDEVVPKVRDACVQVHGAEESPALIMVVEKMPLTIDGVPRRTECQRLASELQQG